MQEHHLVWEQLKFFCHKEMYDAAVHIICRVLNGMQKQDGYDQYSRTVVFFLRMRSLWAATFNTFVQFTDEWFVEPQ